MPMSNRLPVLIFSLAVILAGVLNLPGQGMAQGGGSFFSQGQAVYNAQDLAKSQQEALQDLMVQAVTQALGTVLSPSQMGSHYAALQAKILKQPERYVQTYQIFSENPAGGLYRVTGQVTVAMDVLKKDVRQLGLTPAEAPQSQPVEPAAQEQTEQPVEPAAPQEAVPAPPPEQYPAQVEIPSRPPQSSEQSIFWAVAENWDNNWILPGSSADPRSLFAMSTLQESQDYLWSMSFPQTGSLTVGPSGSLSRERLIALARSVGAQSAITGGLTFRQDSGQGPSLEASLQIIDVSSGQSKGEIRKEMAISSSHQEGAMRMAYVVVPQLDRLVRGSSPPISPQPAVSVAAGDEWTLLVHSEYPYARWEELEEVLRSRFSSMQVNKVEVGPNLVKIRIQGIGSEFFSLLQEGIPLQDGTRMQASGYSPENRSVELSLVRF